MMSILLKIISYQRLTPGQQDSFQADTEKFSLGRSPDNDWVLPDPQRFMSGTHCRLEKRNGTWFITDMSTNGVFLNGSDRRMDKDDSQKLDHGDRIRIGDYEFEVDLGNQASASNILDETTPGISTDLNPDAGLKEINTPLSQMDRGLLGDSVSIDELFHLDDEADIEEAPPSLASQGNQGPALKQHFAAPRVDISQQAVEHDSYEVDMDSIPDDWDVATGLSKSPAPAGAINPDPITPPPKSASAVDAPPPVPPVEPQKAPVRQAKSDSPLAAFAAGAGLSLDQLNVADEGAFFHELGVLLNTMTEGLMQAIASRSQIKSEFRLEQTMIAPVENNPFKFSVSSQEALQRILCENDKAYLSGPTAAAEASDDINAHQMAVLAGTEAALRSILRRFKPLSLENKFTNHSILSKAIPAIGKARFWDFYKAMYDEVSEAADDDFQQMFGAEFSNAYEKQLDRLKIARKDSSK